MLEFFYGKQTIDGVGDGQKVVGGPHPRNECGTEVGLHEEGEEFRKAPG